MRKKLCCILGGIMYAVFYALGWQMEHHQTSASVDTVIQAVMLSIVFALALRILLYMAESFCLKGDEKGAITAIRAFGLLLFFYLLMFVIMYPGIFSYDSPYQFLQIQGNDYSMHHPLLHTLMLGLFSEIRKIVGSFERGMALYTLTQIFLLAFFFAQTCASISRFAGRKAATIALLLFSLHPMHLIFSVIATKDVLFSGAFTWMIALAIETVSQEDDDGWNWKYVAMIVSGVCSCLLRNNMLYAMAAWFILILVLGRFKMRRMSICAIAIIGLALGIQHLLVWATDAEKGDAKEMLSLPMQQIARLCDRSMHNIEPDEYTKIAEAFDYGISWSDYDPTISDPIKDRMHTDRVMADLNGYARLYVTLAKRNPDVFLDAAVELMSPYLYPYGQYDRSRLLIESETNYARMYHAMWSGCLEENARFAGLRNWMTEHLWNDGASDIPVVRWLFNTGLMVWIMLFFVLRELYEGRYRRFAVCMLAVLLWGTYLLGPIMNGRYAYVFLSVLPVLAAYPRQEKKEDTVLLSEQIKGSVV